MDNQDNRIEYPNSEACYFDMTRRAKMGEHIPADDITNLRNLLIHDTETKYNKILDKSYDRNEKDIEEITIAARKKLAETISGYRYTIGLIFYILIVDTFIPRIYPEYMNLEYTSKLWIALGIWISYSILFFGIKGIYLKIREVIGEIF